MISRRLFKIRKGGVRLYKTYSDEGYYIRQIDTGRVYTSAIDVENTPHTYEETDILIPVNKPSKDEETIKEE